MDLTTRAPVGIAGISAAESYRRIQPCGHAAHPIINQSAIINQSDKTDEQYEGLPELHRCARAGTRQTGQNWAYDR